MPDPQLMQIDGHTLAALTYNQSLTGTPIVFIHGFTASIAFWFQGQVPAIAENHPWISLSLPGHYPAVLPQGFGNADLTPDLFPQLLIPAIRKLVGDQPIILIGHSTGGFAALLIAAAAPEMVKGVVSFAGFARGEWAGALGEMQKQVQQGALGLIKTKIQLRMPTLHPSILKSSLKLFAADVDAIYAWPLIDASIADNFAYGKHLKPKSMIPYLAQMPTIDITDRLADISAPVLVLTGDSDPAYPRDEAGHLHQHLPNSELVVFEGAGHMLTGERPTEYNAAVTAWLGTVV